MIIVYTTCRNKKEASRIALHLIKSKLVACANIFPISSIYRWKGRIYKENEYGIFLKTIGKNCKKVENAIKKMHSYELPAIIIIKTEASNSYNKWLKNELAGY
ncbi:MAG: divalent-cation tolerance protein CutA [Candidatus Woesearchaeota archaeon]|nr:divalent-cation tolerance protein CutA [Candidatus Woesearchaeota archaeon]